MTDNANFHINTSMIKRSVLQRNFSIISNDILCNPNLTFEAKGLLCLMLSKPDDWVFHKVWLREQSLNVGRDKLNRILNELKHAGYIGIEQVKGKGKFQRSQWFISDAPQFAHAFEQPCTENPSTDNPSTDNPPLLSTDLTNTDLTNTDSNKNISSNALNKNEIDQVESAFNFFWLNMAMTKQNKIRSEKAFNKLVTRLYIESGKDVPPMQLAQQWCNDTALRKQNRQLGFDNMQPSKYLSDERMFDDVVVAHMPVTSKKDENLNKALADMGISKLIVSTQQSKEKILNSNKLLK